MDSPELLPCPSCTSTLGPFVLTIDGPRQVLCSTCGMRGPYERPKVPESAEAAWNRIATVSDARVAAARAEGREQAAAKMDELAAHYETEADRQEGVDADLHDLAFFRGSAFRDAADDIRALPDPAP